jgi:hypothetical protein
VKLVENTTSNSTSTSTNATPTNTPPDFHSHWDSKPSDYILYSKIARRIEGELEKLNAMSNEEELEEAAEK